MHHRSSQRHRTLKAGMIAFDEACGVSCRVRNLSEGGACLEVPTPIGIPQVFTLRIERDRVCRPCRVAWRSHDRLGVSYI
jgi:hypothetical protein